MEDGHPIQAGEPILRLANQQFQMDAINREAQLLDQQNNLRTTRLSMDQQTNTWKQQLLQLEYDLKQLERTYRLNEGLKERDLVAPRSTSGAGGVRAGVGTPRPAEGQHPQRFAVPPQPGRAIDASLN